MLTDKTLLAKAITLIYRESLLKDTNVNEPMLRTLLDYIKPANLDVASNLEGKQIAGLKDIALRLLETKGKESIELESLIQEVKLVCGPDQETANALIEPLSTELTEARIKRSITDLSKVLQAYIREEKAKEIIFKASNTLRFDRGSIKSWKSFMDTLVTDLEPFTVEVSSKDPNILAEYNLNEESSVTQAFEKLDDITDPKAIIRFGQQGLNNMFNGGLLRGLTGALYALSHHGKSTVAMEIFVDWCMVNTPYMLDTNKKPAFVFISLENEAESNVDMFYRLIREGETGKTLDELPVLNKQERAKYVAAKLGVNGYTPIILRVIDGSWGYRDICNYLIDLEAKGYEIHGLIIDYLHLASKAGIIESIKGESIKALYRMMRRFCAPRKITFLSPHQLNKEARSLARDSDPAEVVTKMVGAGYTESCNTLETEMDFELYLYLVKRKGKYYNTFARGKHRVNKPAPQEFHYTCYESHDAGRMRIDINGPSQALKRPGDKVQAQWLDAPQVIDPDNPTHVEHDLFDPLSEL